MASYYAALCDPCPAGYFCVGGGSAPEICLAGHECPAETARQDGLQCPIGAYQPEQGRTKCLTCPPGKYCDQPGQAAPAGDCAGGYYCKQGSATAYPAATAAEGGQCKAGEYCEPGSALPRDCLPGYACPSTLMKEADMLLLPCNAGYYCWGGATSQTPSSSTVGGDRCPAGHYCVQ